MKALWIAHLFSLNCKSSLSEFLALQSLVRDGCSVLDEKLEDSSSSWRELKKSNSSYVTKNAYLEFRGIIEAAIEKGIQFTCPGREDFPHQLLQLSEVPFFLSYWGQPVWKGAHGLAVVGTREPSPDSEAWCEQELAAFLLSFPIFTVSGGARGIDQICHRVSTRLGLPTVVFLPSGIEQMYPSTLGLLTESILACGGVFVSEYLPSVSMRKQFFPRRNRLIAGLSLVCLIIEARRRSGTLITAQQALAQHKPLLILPSHPYDGGAKGGLDLLLDGATPVRDAQDLITFISAELLGAYGSLGDLVSIPSGHHYL